MDASRGLAPPDPRGNWPVGPGSYRNAAPASTSPAP